jgi:hypothetical protein
MSARPGVRPTRHPNVVTVRRDVFLRALDRDLAELGLTRAEFTRQGSAGTLVSDRAQSLWNMVDPDLLRS